MVAFPLNSFATKNVPRCHTFHVIFFSFLAKGVNFPGIIDHPLKFHILYLYSIAILSLKKNKCLKITSTNLLLNYCKGAALGESKNRLVLFLPINFLPGDGKLDKLAGQL